MIDQTAVERLISERHQAWYQREYIAKERAESLEPPPRWWSPAFWLPFERRRRQHNNDLIERLYPQYDTRGVAEVEADIARLPEVRARETVLAAGQQSPLGLNKRLFIKLELPPQVDRPVERAFFDQRVSNSFEDFRTGVGTHVSFCNPDEVRFRQEASRLRTSEAAVERRGSGGGYQDWTHTWINLELSLGVSQALRERCLEFHELVANSPERLVLLSIDVPSETYFSSQQLAPGEGELFRGISSGPFQPIRYALHFFLPPPWSKQKGAQSQSYPPMDYALDYPYQTIEIEECIAGEA
ncbi:MAG: hypothetical protein ACRDBL_07060 [Rhabdaerophilum sp.]